MIRIDFSTTPESDLPEKRLKNLALHSEADLRYGFFQRAIYLEIGGVKFLDGGGYALLDFMSTLSYTLKELRDDGKTVIDFSENSGKIFIARDGEALRFNSSWGISATCGIIEYPQAVIDFIERGVSDLLSEYPELKDHLTLSKIIRSVAD
ncbi:MULTISPECIES: hypothetical protein [Streptomyces]|uniref:Uncharacterized protein n=2 Tax=Streptomyces TaxID=1883 RepID=A0ABU2RL92_9ACTN|nr:MULTISPECIES: hypothetical protein [unclassified Streptomyces]MBK3594315.1 hypothetical protein [Streptomyces sp. MBT51]MDT0429627.1 hypothetical protein [Streptomyces sp. DSM 41770]